MKYLLSLITLLFFVASPLQAQEELAIGATAPTFNLKNIDGELYSFDSFESAKGYIVIFTCNHCPFSVAYEDRIIEMQKKFEPMGYPVIAINPNDAETYPTDSYEAMKVRAEEKDFNFVYLHDETQEIAKAYGASRTPHIFLVDADKTVQYVGAIDDNTYSPESVSANWLADAIMALDAGKKIDPEHTKAVGCSIKWKK